MSDNWSLSIAFGALLVVSAIAWRTTTSGATRLLVFAYAMFLFGPFAWIYARPTTAFYQVPQEYLPVAYFAFTAFLISWCIGERVANLVVGRAFIGGDFGRAVIPVVLVSLALSVIANAYLISIGQMFIGEDSSRQRVPIFSALANGHILGLLLLISDIFTRSAHERRPFVRLLLIGVLVYAVLIGFLEGRRTAVVFPLFLLFLASAITGRVPLRRLLVYLMGGALLFVIATSVRVGIDLASTAASHDLLDALVLGGDLIAGRIGNPGIITGLVFEHLDQDTRIFDPKTFENFLSAFVPSSLLPPPFDASMGNDFGRHLSLLSESNYITAINTGWVGELVLIGRFPAVVAGGVLCGLLAVVIWRLFTNGSTLGLFARLFMGVFIVSGLQMELVHPLFALLRGLAVALIVASLGWLLGRGGVHVGVKPSIA